MYHDINTVENDVEYLLRNYQQAALGTNGKRYPEVSKVTPVLADDDTIYLLLSDLSTHTRNLYEVSRTVSVYFVGESRHATEMNNPRVTLFGKLEMVTDRPKKDFLEMFNKRDPGATMYGQFGDFNIWRFVAQDRIYIEGFGKAYK